MIDLEKLREVMIDLRDKDYNHGASPAEVLELLDHIAQLEKYESKLITERDHRDDVIDRMADAVLGSDRHEWTSAYDIDDAAEEVEQRIAQLEKDAARYRWLFGARTEVQVASVSETVFKPLPQDEVLSHLQGFYMSKTDVDALIDAARKQGEK